MGAVTIALALALWAVSVLAAVFAALWWAERSRRVTAEAIAGRVTPQPARTLDTADAEERLYRMEDALRRSRMEERAKDIAPDLDRPERETLVDRAMSFMYGGGGRG